MAIGHSGGRSAGNRRGDGANRRSTVREREGIDPPGRDEWQALQVAERPRVTLTPRGRTVLDFALLLAWGFACCFLAILVAAWFGVFD